MQISALPPKAKITAEVCSGRTRPKLNHGSMFRSGQASWAAATTPDEEADHPPEHGGEHADAHRPVHVTVRIVVAGVAADQPEGDQNRDDEEEVGVELEDRVLRARRHEQGK
ncbi:MAG: hypothetical protein ACMVO3_07100 [Thalassobaculum sp.]